MATFSRSRRDSAHVPHPPQAVWDLLVDPDVVARLTPLVARIEVRDAGDASATWVWHLQGVPLAGKVIDLTMTEEMTFDPLRRIGFDHAELSHTLEAGAEGCYELEPEDGGTRLGIDLTVSARLPLPSLARPAVNAAMAQVLRFMGSRFAAHLQHELDGPGT